MTPSRGFTLLEVMIVMLLIGVVASMAVLGSGLGLQGNPAEQAARRLQALAQLAADEAVLGGEAVGLGLTRGGYAFLQQRLVDPTTYAWQPLETEGALRPRTLDARQLDLELRVEGVPVSLPAASATPAPQIYFDATGDITAFALRLAGREPDDPAWVLDSTNGRLRLLPD